MVRQCYIGSPALPAYLLTQCSDIAVSVAVRLCFQIMMLHLFSFLVSLPVW